MTEVPELWKRICHLWDAQPPAKQHNGSLSWVVGQAALDALEADFEARWRGWPTDVGPYWPESRSDVPGSTVFERTIFGRPVAVDGGGDEVRLEAVA